MLFRSLPTVPLLNPNSSVFSHLPPLDGRPDLDPMFPDASYHESHHVLDGMDEQYEVQDLTDYRIADVFDGDGNPLPYKVEEFRVRWKGYPASSSTWESASSLRDMADWSVKQAEDKFRSQIDHERSRFPGQVYGYDYEQLSTEEKEPADNPEPDGLPADDPVTEDHVASDAQRGNEWLTAESLMAVVDRIPVVSNPTGPVRVGSDGDVHVPYLDPVATERFRYRQKVEGAAMSQEQLAVLRDEGEQIALGARAKGKQLLSEEPRHYWECLKDVNYAAWSRAMDEEMANMESFGVWSLVPRPANKNVMSCKWVYKIKRNKDGSVARMKARLTSRGFTQREGVDFNETWAPTCRMRVFRMLMAEASSNPDVMTAQWDCTAAFLHANVDCEMYMEQPQG